MCAQRNDDDLAMAPAAVGLPTPAPPPKEGEAAILALLVEAETYLADFSGPGVAEVREGLITALPCAPASSTNPVIEAYLGKALAALTPDSPSLAATIMRASPHLGWITYDRYPEDQIGSSFARGHAYAVLAKGPDYEFGVFLIAPGVLYRDHCHPAPELYAPLTGPHRWRFGVGTPLVEKPAHVPVWNEPNATHLTKVGDLPFLCLYGWTRDVHLPARVIPAPDWAEIERLAPRPPA